MAKQRKSRAASLLQNKISETSERVFPSKEETMKLVDSIGTKEPVPSNKKEKKASVMFSLRLSAHVYEKLKDKSDRVGISMKSIIMNGLIKELDL